MISKIYSKVAAACFVCCGMTAALTSCDDFIDVDPQGVISEDLAMSQPDEMVTSAYAKLGDDWYTYPFNLWPYGDVSSDDAMKGGSGTTDTNYNNFCAIVAFFVSNFDQGHVLLMNRNHT